MKATSKLASHDNDDRGGHMHAKSERKHGEKKRASGLGHTYRDSSSTRAMIRSSFRSTRVRISFVSFSPCCHLASFWRPGLLHACHARMLPYASSLRRCRLDVCAQCMVSYDTAATLGFLFFCCRCGRCLPAQGAAEYTYVRNCSCSRLSARSCRFLGHGAEQSTPPVCDLSIISVPAAHSQRPRH